MMFYGSLLAIGQRNAKTEVNYHDGSGNKDGVIVVKLVSYAYNDFLLV